MTTPIEGLSVLADRYEALLCDIWGVIHDGVAAFPQACAALATWRTQRGPVVLISNSPRPREEVVAQLDQIGVPRAAWSAIVTSGDATRVLLAERAPGPAWRIGPDRDLPLYAGLGLEFSDLDAARFIACTGPNDDEVETPEDYRAVLALAAARGLEMICANPDRVVQRGDRLIYCGGALADLYQSLGGVATMVGKPHAPIYALALTQAGVSADDRGRVLAIGDGVATDLAGAQAQGLDALFIAAGIHAEDLPGEALEAGAVARLLHGAGVGAAFAMRRLAW